MHGKLKLANSCWQTQVGVRERRKNSRQTRWQTIDDKQNVSKFWPTFSRTFSCWQTRIWRVNGLRTCVGDCQPIKTRPMFTSFAWHFTKWRTDVKTILQLYTEFIDKVQNCPERLNAWFAGYNDTKNKQELLDERVARYKGQISTDTVSSKPL